MHIFQWFLTNLLAIGLIPAGETVLNGRIAHSGEFKYQVLIIIFGSKTCSGSIITGSHILTAAHCVDIATKYDVLVLAGTLTIRRQDAAAVRNVHEITIHDKYIADPQVSSCKACFQRILPCVFGNPALNELPKNDIAVLTLEDPLPLGGNIARISYQPRGPSTSDCSSCLIAGWGLYTKTQYSKVLRWTIYSILSPSDCKKNNAPHRKTEFCAMDTSKRTTVLDGDSGGPLVCNGVLVGIASTAIPDPQYPATFVDVSQYIDFIEGVIERDKSYYKNDRLEMEYYM